MKPRISLRQSLQDPNLLGGALTGESWAAWRTLLVASMGESLTEDERATFQALTGRVREPSDLFPSEAEPQTRENSRQKRIARASRIDLLDLECGHSDRCLARGN